jgi:hypothetical protein
MFDGRKFLKGLGRPTTGLLFVCPGVQVARSWLLARYFCYV